MVCMLPTLSVITPSYNQGEFLEETLRSVIRQDYGPLEYIVIDGGSTDDSVDIIKSYAGNLHYWVSEPDGSHTAGLLKGFARASGEILCWLNSDDLFEPGALVEVGHFFSTHPELSVVYGDALWIDRSGKVVRPKKEHGFNRFIWTYDHNFIPQPSTFWRKSVYDQVGGLDTSYQLAFDADFWIRLADITPLHHVPRIWSRMRLYPEQRNQKFRALSDHEDLCIRRTYIGNESFASRKCKKVIAKSMRVAWKVATGCYWC